MAKVFLDASSFIDIIENRGVVDLESFKGHSLFISPLSIHILVYVYRYKIPNEKLAKLRNFINIATLDQQIASKSLSGPTSDFEDNVQLHTAAAAECEVFLTKDKKLLGLRFFGKVQITPNLP
jgi:predicted nucleic acid-binding protein